MSEKKPIEVAHSSCPQKRGIQPPQFVVIDTFKVTGSGSLVQMECEGCLTRITLTAYQHE